MGNMADTTCWKLFRVVMGLLEAAVYSLTLSGWPAFMYIFIEEGFYYSRCDFDIVANASAGCTALDNCTQKTDGETLVQKCTEQEEMLNLVYTVAFVGLGSLFILGYVYDHCGTVCLRIISICFCAGGCFLMALVERGIEWLLFPGAVFHLMGGFQLAVTDVQMAVLFPKLMTTLICLVSGAQDVSGFVPVLLKMAYQAGVSYKTSMFTFTGIILLMSSVNTFTLPPRQDDDGHNIDVDCCLKMSKRSRITKEASTGIHKFGQNDVNESAVNEQLVPSGNVEANEEETGGEAGGMNYQDALNLSTFCQHFTKVSRKETCFERSAPMIQGMENPDSKENDESTNIGLSHGTLLIMKRPIFWMLLLWLICQGTVIITYDGCFYAIISYYGNNAKNTISTYTDVYSWLQVASLFWALLTGLMLDKLLTKATQNDKMHCFVGPFFLTVLAGVIVSIACTIPIIEMQLVAVVFHSLLKTGTFAVHFAFVISAFPKEHFGKAYGVQVTVSSLLTFIELPIFSWYKHSLESDPLWLGVLFLGICFTASCLPFYLLWRRYGPRGLTETRHTF